MLVGQRHETPHQVQSLDRITFSHCVDDGAALDLQIIDQGSPVLPVDEPAGAGDRRQPFADFSRNRGGALLPASSSLRRCLAVILPVLISINSSESR